MTLYEFFDIYGLYLLIGAYPNGPLGGLAITIIISALALILSFPLGILLGVLRVSPYKWCRLPTTAFVYVIRGLPFLMVLFWVYYFSKNITGFGLSQFTSILVVLVIFDGVYLAEIIRAGIQGLPKGQFEASRALGFSYYQTMRLTILPQCLKNMLPSLVNQFVSTIKATSLGVIIGLQEFTFIATQVNNQVFTMQLEVYTMIAFTYFALCFSLSRLAYFIEKKQQQKFTRASGLTS